MRSIEPPNQLQASQTSPPGHSSHGDLIMAPTTTKTTTTPRAHTQAADDTGQPELAQQFTTVKDYTAYVLARMQQVNPGGPMDTSTPDLDIDETETEVRPRKEKRIKGRRRAANPVATVEASLRRQAELKSNFRNLARPLKSVLDEMGRRTIDSLESDSLAHERANEHAHVETGLLDALSVRTTSIKRGKEYHRAQLEAKRDAEEHMLRRQYEQSVIDTQDRFLDHFDHRMLQIERQSRMADAIANQDTDDEDDVILQPHQMSYRFDRGSTLPPEYDSRSRLGLAVDDAHGRLGARRDMRDMLQDQDMYFERGYTVMDPTVRDAALARRHGMEGVELLARATQEVESEAQQRRPKQAIISDNRAHTSLMELADMATKPYSARNDMPPPETPLRRPSTATRIDNHDDGLLARSSMIGTNNRRKRSRSGTQMLSSPYIRETLGDRLPQQMLLPPGPPPPHRDRVTPDDPEIKEEDSPLGQPIGGLRTPLLLKPIVEAHHLGDTALPQRQSYDVFNDNRFEAHPSATSRASLDRRSIIGKDDSYGRAWTERGRVDETSAQQSPRIPMQALASPFTHHLSPMFAQSSRPPSDYDGHFRPMEFNHRPLLQQPPVPPTAQPVNHFANSSAHRNTFTGGPYQPRHTPSSWSSISPSPLVALPQGETTPRMQPGLPFFNGPAFSPFQQQQQQQPQPQQHHVSASHGVPPPPPTARNQYGGPTLAPAAGPFHTPQPAFAQQMGRQEQGRRRNTEGAFPRFREYRGPN